MDLKENFAVISGEVPPSIKQKLDDITEISKDRYKDIKKGYHEWVDTLDNKRLQSLIDEVRSDSSILDGIHAKFPNSSITPITDVDEIYWSVSPADAKASDRLLVDCHYDTPFALLPTGGVVFYRVLIGCNENNDIITHFPAENIDVKMSTGDYHGLDYNQDYHCVTGTIPSGKIRVLLKLHYAVVPKGSEDWKETTISWNRWWAVFSRNTMNSTSNPKNMYDQVLSYIFGYLRFIYLNIRYIIVFILIVLIAYYYRNNFKYLRRKR
jgi:hypothetical protein